MCRLSDETCSTCGDFGICEGNPPQPSPTPSPLEDCDNPAIFANPNPGKDSNNDGEVVVNLRVDNQAHDILNYAFVWDFGDGNHNQTTLTGAHAFSVECEQTRTYGVYWEGWCRKNDGSDRFITATTSVTVLGACVSTGGVLEECTSNCYQAF